MSRQRAEIIKDIASLIIIAAIPIVARLILRANSTLLGDDPIMGFFRDTPNHLFYPGVLILLSMAIAIELRREFLHRKLEKKRAAAKPIEQDSEKARRIATSLWRVTGRPSTLESCMSLIQFTHQSWDTQKLKLLVFYDHPDATKFDKLTDGNIVEFEALPEETTSTFQPGPSGYLRIKSIS